MHVWLSSNHNPGLLTCSPVPHLAASGYIHYFLFVLVIFFIALFNMYKY